MAVENLWLLVSLALVVIGIFLLFTRQSFKMGRKYEHKRIIRKIIWVGVDSDRNVVVAFNLMDILRDDSDDKINNAFVGDILE